MSKPIRFASTVSILACASILAACAAPQTRTASASAVRKGDSGLALKALNAINANQPVQAVAFAEQAVEQTPGDATLRALLGNAYFVAGRFASAETAFKDSLALNMNQPQVLLKVALVEIAQGKISEALAFLDAGKTMLPAADYGLALALAGQPSDAIAVLDSAARMRGADARVRQNLALAHALAGDWVQARLVAAQDIPAGELDGRLQQWMQLAKPARPTDQVAALTGVTPSAADAGQPVRLALRAEPNTRMASAAVEAPAAPAPEAQVVQVAAAAPEAYAPPPPPPPPPPAPEYVAPPVVQAAPPPPPPPPPPAASFAQAAASAPEAPALFAAMSHAASKPKPRPAVAKARVAPRKASLRTGKSNAVVQLGAYGSTQRVMTAWDSAARRHAMLRSYTPMSARFESQVGTVYRLSVKGFASVGEAQSVCASLRRSGASCFVRNVAGDAPVQFASR